LDGSGPPFVQNPYLVWWIPDFLKQLDYAGRRTNFRQKIERFFWRDFSGEELLPENSFLGQKIRSILSNQVIS